MESKYGDCFGTLRFVVVGRAHLSRQAVDQQCLLQGHGYVEIGKSGMIKSSSSTEQHHHGHGRERCLSKAFPHRQT